METDLITSIICFFYLCEDSITLPFELQSPARTESDGDKLLPYPPLADTSRDIYSQILAGQGLKHAYFQRADTQTRYREVRDSPYGELYHEEEPSSACAALIWGPAACISIYTLGFGALNVIAQAPNTSTLKLCHLNNKASRFKTSLTPEKHIND